MTGIPRWFALASVLALAGCSSSHRAGDGEPCGPTRCEAGEVCCDAVCGTCVARGASCPDIGCIDAGEYPDPCGDGACGAGQACCPGCPGQPPICVPEGTACPLLECPPPPPGCEICEAAGELCCPACPGDPMFCTDGSICPELDCPAPTCDDCGPGERCCPGCPGAPPFCSAADACPVPDCPPPPSCDSATPCPNGFYCDFDSGCGGPGHCVPVPAGGCPRTCPGVCGCDGNTYCNACIAATMGVDVARTGSCDTTACAGREYCGCNGACEPLVDLSTGCICPCDDPFNCTGELCACACGGATYLGCAPAGACAEPTPDCGPGCHAVLGADGCPVCVCESGGAG